MVVHFVKRQQKGEQVGMQACDTTSWPREVNPDRGELLPSNRRAPPVSERPGLWPIRRRSTESEGTATADKIFACHPSSQTTAQPSQDRPQTCVCHFFFLLLHFLTWAPARHWVAASPPDGLWCLIVGATCYSRRLHRVCREGDISQLTPPPLPPKKRKKERKKRGRFVGQQRRAEAAPSTVTWQSQGPWPRSQEVCRGWWGRPLTRTTRGADTPWKVRGPATSCCSEFQHFKTS